MLFYGIIKDILPEVLKNIIKNFILKQKHSSAKFFTYFKKDRHFLKHVNIFQNLSVLDWPSKPIFYCQTNSFLIPNLFKILFLIQNDKRGFFFLNVLLIPNSWWLCVNIYITYKHTLGCGFNWPNDSRHKVPMQWLSRSNLHPSSIPQT